ncbi:MAG: hypothetical protein NC306_15165 [Butyrivibrio sp.]|nr:hypothetical protein [Butyrivibrio sp.]
MSSLVPKSVRLPQELVEYVEGMPGKNFSQKLVGLLSDVRAGEDFRCREIEEQEQRMARNRAELEEQSSRILEASRLLHRLAGILSWTGGALSEDGAVRDD